MPLILLPFTLAIALVVCTVSFLYGLLYCIFAEHENY